MTMFLNQQKSRSVRQAALTLFAAALVSPLFGFAHTQPKPQSAIQPKIQIVSGAQQQTAYKSAFEAPLVVSVTNPQTQQPLVGVTVKFETSPGLALSTTSTTTDSAGLASIVVTGLAVGSYRVKAEIAATSGAPEASVTFEHLRVEKAVLTIVPGDLFSSVGTIPTLTQYTIHGFVNGETPETAQLTGTPLLSTGATKTSHDANYAIKGGIGSLYAPNYRFVAGFGTLVLVGGSKSDATESATLYDADGKPITLTDATESANAVRKAFLDSSMTISAGSTGAISAKPVQPAKELSRATAKQTAPVQGEVKAVADLKQPKDLSRKDTAPLGEVKSVVTLPKANIVTWSAKGISSEVRGALAKPADTLPNITPGSVQAATILMIQTVPTAEPVHVQGEIRNAFPPTAH